MCVLIWTLVRWVVFSWVQTKLKCDGMKETCRNHKAHRLSNRFASANILLLSYTQAIIKCVATDLHHLHKDYGRSLAITYLFTPKFAWKVKLIESSAELEYGKKQQKHTQLHRITNRFQRFTMQSVRWAQNTGVFLDVRS